MTYIPSFPATEINRIDTYRLSATRYNTGITNMGNITIDNTWRYVRGLVLRARRRYPTTPWIWFQRGEFTWDMQRWGNLQYHYFTYNGTLASVDNGGANWYARGYGDSGRSQLQVRTTNPGVYQIPLLFDVLYFGDYAPSTSPTYSQSLWLRLLGDTNQYIYSSVLMIVYREV